jgi:hypothetical protein
VTCFWQGFIFVLYTGNKLSCGTKGLLDLFSISAAQSVFPLGSAEEGYLSTTSRATSTLALSADWQDLETIPGFEESRLCIIGPQKKKKKKKKNTQTDHG